MGSMYGIFLHIFPTKKQLLYKFWSSLICSDLPSKLAKKQIFRYHKLYDIIYIIYYIIIYVYIIYIYIYYISVPLMFKKNMLFWWISPNPISNPKIDMSLGGRLRLGCEVSMREFVSKRILSKPRTSPRLRWNLGRLFREPNGENYGSMGMHGIFIYLHEWLDLLWEVSR